MAERRKHSKISKMPEELRLAVENKLQQGFTYQQINDWIGKQGMEVSLAAVGRYGKDFMEKLERLRTAREQAKIIVDQSKDGQALGLMEATSHIMIQKLFEEIVKRNDLDEASIVDLYKVYSLLERSGVAREKLLMEQRRKADEAAQKVAETARAKGLDEETLRVIKEQIYGIVS